MLMLSIEKSQYPFCFKKNFMKVGWGDICNKCGFAGECKKSKEDEK